MRRIVAIVTAGILTAPAMAVPELTATGAACVADEEFPRLLPYVLDGWDMKHEFAESPPQTAVGATLHLYMRNTGDEPATVTRVMLEGIRLDEQIVPAYREVDSVRAAGYLLNQETTTPAALRAQLDALGGPQWYGVRPRVVPPGGFGEVTVRLRTVPAARLMRLAAGTDQGLLAQSDAAITTALALRVAFSSFSDSGDRLFLNLRKGGGDFEIASVELDGAGVGLEPASPQSFRGALPIEMLLDPPWGFGTFHHIAVRASDGVRAEALVRARDAFFALGMWGYRNHGDTDAERTSDTLAAIAANHFNTHMGMGFLDGPDDIGLVTSRGMRLHAREPNQATRGNPAVYARFLLDEPDAHDASVDALPPNRRLGALAQGIVARRDRWLRMDPRALSLLNVDLTCKPENWWTYGQVADIMALDPYYQGRLVDAYWKHPGYLGRCATPFYVYACAEIARWAASPRPTHVILNCVSHVEEGRRFRFGTPEEKRIEFHHALAAGAKGISYWWFTPYGEFRGCGSGEPQAEAMLSELQRLNAMARAMEPVFAHAWPAIGPGAVADPVTTCAPAWLFPRTLYAGRKSAVVVLVNRDHSSDAAGTQWQPIPKTRVFLRRPPWLEATWSVLVTPDGSRVLEPHEAGGVLEYEIADFPLAAVLLVTSDAVAAARARGFGGTLLVPKRPVTPSGSRR